LAVGEIPSLKDKGALWRTQLLFSLVSDYEIIRIRFLVVIDRLTCNKYRHKQTPWFRLQSYSMLEKNELVGPMGKLSTLWKYTKMNFVKQQIQEGIDPSTTADD